MGRILNAGEDIGGVEKIKLCQQKESEEIFHAELKCFFQEGVNIAKVSFVVVTVAMLP